MFIKSSFAITTLGYDETDPSASTRGGENTWGGVFWSGSASNDPVAILR